MVLAHDWLAQKQNKTQKIPASSEKKKKKGKVQMVLN